MPGLTYLERHNAAPCGSEEQRSIIEEIEREIRDAGVPTEAAMRAQLRALMAECPACSADDADDVEPDKLAGWILSHGAEPGAEVS